MDDATIEDDIEEEQNDRHDSFNNRTTLLPWSTIFHLLSEQWIIFIIISLIIGFYLYYNAKQQRTSQMKKTSSIHRTFDSNSSTNKRSTKKD